MEQTYQGRGYTYTSCARCGCLRTAALQKTDFVTQEILLKACEKTKLESEKAITADDHTNIKKANVSDQTKNTLKEVIQKQIDQEKADT